MADQRISDRLAKTPSPAPSTTPSRSTMDDLAQQLAFRVSEQLPAIVEQLLHEGYDASAIPWQLECSLTTANNTGMQPPPSRFPIAAVNLAGNLASLSPRSSPLPGNYGHGVQDLGPQLEHAMHVSTIGSGSGSSTGENTPLAPTTRSSAGSNKRRKTTRQRTTSSLSTSGQITVQSGDLVRTRSGDDLAPARRRKKAYDNPAHQPSTLPKYISGVWESLYSGPKIDITEVVEQWQALECDGQPKLLTDVEQEVATRSDTAVCKCISIR